MFAKRNVYMHHHRKRRTGPLKERTWEICNEHFVERLRKRRNVCEWKYVRISHEFMDHFYGIVTIAPGC